jgi:hypothetical protein
MASIMDHEISLADASTPDAAAGDGLRSSPPPLPPKLALTSITSDPPLATPALALLPPSAGSPNDVAAPDASTPQPPPVAQAAERRRRLAWLVPRVSLANIGSAVRHWIVVSGVWWMFSTTLHATILAVTLLLLGAVVTPRFESTAPSFESALNTEIADSDLEHFDVTSGSIDMREVGQISDDITASAGNVGVVAGAGGGTADGTAGAGEAASGLSSASRGGTAAGGGGAGASGGMDVRGLKDAWKKNGAHLATSGSGGARWRAANGGLQSAGDVNQAVDGVLKGISEEAEKGDLLVCWLIDASISLADDRQLIANRIEPYFRRIEAQDAKKSYKLLNSVVAFSDTTYEVVKPTTFSSQIVEAIRSLPLATSGVENVMSAVSQCIDQYARRWKGGIVIVVWTDESGDDILYLEQVIRRCKRRDIVVSVVGPTAVLGSEQGRHHYVDKNTGFAFLLPIKRGPDTSLPERLFLPYWHDSPLAPWIQNDVVAASGVPWYGGPHREGLLSGVGPYALTRLALETGGTFTLLDRKEDRGPFQWDVMKRYLPDYGSASEYIDAVNAKPLRKAVSAAVMATYQEVNLIPPATAFVLQRYPYYPYPIHRPYYTPEQFRSLLRDAVLQQQALVKEGNRVVEEALAHFPQEGMEYDYLAERSPRWKAWYDLTRGRLLAMSVRHLEYVLACERMLQSGSLRPETNHVVLKPSRYYLAGKTIEPRAREAFRLLTRCVQQNAGTPWALLAQWELNHELGIEIEQVVVPVPTPGGPPRAPDPPITFPKL